MSETSRRQFIQSALASGVLAPSVAAAQVSAQTSQEVTVGNDRHAPFDTYSKRYQTIRMRREDGIIELQFHTNGGSLQWSSVPHDEFGGAFFDIGRDTENGVVILTGTGDDWSGPAVPAGGVPGQQSGPVNAENWDSTYWHGKQLLTNLLNIEVPVISAINGPAYRHAEIPLLSDITIASDTAAFQDTAHFQGGLVPGDGVHVLFPLLLGLNRGRYFLLTGQRISAMEAKELGLVNEVLPKGEVLPRAWALARELMKRPPLRRRYARVLMTQELKHRMLDLLGYGLALEGLGSGER